jgi:K+-transporting ATPase ATPase C chain
MMKHLRVNLFLLGFTLLFCAVLYPLVVLGIGQVVFGDRADGSLIDARGQPVTDPAKAVGSRLIAQAFSGDEYFQPRPSAAGYNGAASAASNWGASNYLLRDRVARTLGPVVRYKGSPPNGKTVQDDVRAWFEKQADPVTEWANAHSGVAQAWVNADDKHKAAVTDWQKGTPEGAAAAAAWKKDNPDAEEPKPADLAVPFFTANAKAFHEKWPKLIDDSTWAVEAVFFDAWLQENPQAALEEVPADMVMASGSGLDPHITHRNALYQLDRVAGKWAELTKRDAARVRQEVEQLLTEKADAPLGGLVGVKLVNVLEVNLALRERYGAPQAASR